MEEDIAHVIARLVLQLAVVLVAAKLAGEVCERYLRVPAVLGELVAGVVIGPYALGGLALGPLDPLFPRPTNPEANPVAAVPQELYALGQVGAVVLLFVAGLETDLKQFLRFVGPASVVATGGVILPFAFGAAATVAFGFAPQGLADPHALFVGAVLTATSVGITARVLSDLHQLNSPEGVTVLGAAVVDDVLGILVLTVVVGIAATGHVSAGEVGFIAAKAIGFWVALTGLGILLAPRIARLLSGFRVPGGTLALVLALAFLAAWLAESVGLAMIIGAYSIGLALSQTDLAKRLEAPLLGVYNALVPVFFVGMGMLVNISAMQNALVFGAVISLLAIVGKVFGCGLPALVSGFNLRGAARIGIGMLPRGEVALIVAGVALARNAISTEIFGVAIMMTLVTTVLAPVLLVPLFRRGGVGTRRRGPTPQAQETPGAHQ
ncbi:MAG: cation:proton antiporter [Chloroflexi bacterium]|nr:cation:proton antiporter [Chloroflexota bacterium]